MFWYKKDKKKKSSGSNFDKSGKIPVLKSSICTGETVAGFQDRVTGKFEDIMLIRDEKDLEKFLSEYGVLREEIRKEW